MACHAAVLLLKPLREYPAISRVDNTVWGIGILLIVFLVVDDAILLTASGCPSGKGTFDRVDSILCSFSNWSGGRTCGTANNPGHWRDGWAGGTESLDLVSCEGRAEDNGASTIAIVSCSDTAGRQARVRTTQDSRKNCLCLVEGCDKVNNLDKQRQHRD